MESIFVIPGESIGIRFDSVNLLVWSGNREQGTGNREHRKKDRIDTY
ncbi:MAG: hypothetical protein ACK6A9_05505 [Dolichospermum sp.]